MVENSEYRHSFLIPLKCLVTTVESELLFAPSNSHFSYTLDTCTLIQPVCHMGLSLWYQLSLDFIYHNSSVIYCLGSLKEKMISEIQWILSIVDH